MDRIESLKKLIKRVKKEIQNESDRKKKQRLNKYKQKLEIELRDLTFIRNGGNYNDWKS